MFLILGIKILKRDKQRLNILLSCFYLFSSFGIFLNFIYVPLSIIEGYELLVLILNYSTIFVIAFSISFLVLSLIIILKSTVDFNDKKQWFLLLMYAIFYGSLFIFLNFDGVVFNEETDWIAAFSPSFYFYLLFLLLIGGFIPTIALSIMIRRKFENIHLKKRWDYFISGIILIFIFLFLTYTINFVNRTAMRLNMMKFSGLLGLGPIILVIAGASLVYYGIGKQLSS